MDPIDFADLDALYGTKIPKRIQEYNTALRIFLSDRSTAKQYPDVDPYFVEDAAPQMAYLAYHLNTACTRPFIANLSDRYKIASITEVVVCLLQPIVCRNATEQLSRELNADFALYCAIQLLDNFREEDESIDFRTSSTRIFSEDIPNVELYKRMDRVMQNHAAYLAHLGTDLAVAPIISNAFVLEMIDLFYKFQWQSLPI